MTPLEQVTERWLEALAMRNMGRGTVAKRRSCMRVFTTWCAERGIDDAAVITRSMVERYQRHLYYYRVPEHNKDWRYHVGQPLGVRTQQVRLSTLKLFFAWLARQRWIAANPASEIELPRCPQRLPRALLTPAEINAVMTATTTHGDLGIRDRAIMETLYGSGIRAFECAQLTVYDVDTGNGTLMVREGKNKKDRLLPIGARACEWIEKYVIDVRPKLLTDPNEQALFLTFRGAPFSNTTLGSTIRSYYREVGITKPGACHLFRHAMATAMLDNGADLRFIQMMLGHSNIETTTVYTQVSLTKLREVYDATHPAKETRTHRTGGLRDAQADLLDALDAEADEESRVERVQQA